MSPRERILLGVTVAVVGGALTLTLGVEPAVTRWRELSAERARLEEEVERDRALAAALRDLVHERRALLGSLEPPEGQALVPWLIDHLRDLTREAGFEPAALRYVSGRPLPAPAPTAGSASGSRAEAGPFAELRFELEARTTLERLQRFCVALAASDRAVRVAAVSLAPERAGADLTANLTLVALAPASAAQEAGR